MSGDGGVATTTRTHRPVVLGLAGVALLAIAYPLFAQATQRPLGIFVIPILVVAAFGSWIDTVAVGAVAMIVSTIEGALVVGFDGVGLTTRLAVMAVIWVVAVVVAWERRRRELLVDDSLARGIILDAFQDSLVPTPIPPDGVHVRTRYLPGDDRLLLGGDFFDAIRLPNGSLGYVIGDVCGHGPRAAAFGAALRSGWKALATTAPSDPLRWVQGLEETFFRLGRHSDTFATLNTGYVELGQRPEWCFVSAGHPWPIVVDDDEIQMVEPHVGPPLGVRAGAGAWQTTERSLGIGVSVVLYTDGLIENPLPDGTRRTNAEVALRGLLGARGLDLDGLLHAFGPHGFDDDVAIVTFTLS